MNQKLRFIQYMTNLNSMYTLYTILLNQIEERVSFNRNNLPFNSLLLRRVNES